MGKTDLSLDCIAGNEGDRLTIDARPPNSYRDGDFGAVESPFEPKIGSTCSPIGRQNFYSLVARVSKTLHKL